ncbi:oxidoreductase [Streptosporangium sp. NPDC023615]|uniref:oxidoreductase n=1 Tax=Streptosporangium sp. NPDC023615 TaxID=3154794 RepID=UPI003414F4B2
MEASGSMTANRWTEADVPDQGGRVALVTGANTGIGLETARVLAGRGTTVVIACRDTAKAAVAVERIRAGAASGAGVEVLRLDLASLESVRRAASEFLDRHERLDLLVNNAGVMAPPPSRTEEGFELQFGVNHLGHFALTGLLLGALLKTAGSRVVTVASIAHQQGRMDLGDLRAERSYNAYTAYGRSKLANLMFTYELQRRLVAAGAGTIALAAHPGISRTELSRNLSPVLRALNEVVGALVLQDARTGALPSLRAATDPAARGGDYYGPSGVGGFRGHPRRVRSSARSHDGAVQRRLWTESERLSGVVYEL